MALKHLRDYPKICVNLQCGASILHHIGGLHKFWDSLSAKEFYHNAIDHHIIPKLGNVKLEKLTMLQIQQFYNELLKSGRVQKKNQPELKEHGTLVLRIR